ncbi:hypothetical protein [Brackiella oedipodis]|uniref:hypothetical protein n=1 Tax=Brackiella oedipodis TaxID=124225 RepID=UPI00048B5F15|nr:hypothetical protein [Brackiella oedipodis]
MDDQKIKLPTQDEIDSALFDCIFQDASADEILEAFDLVAEAMSKAQKTQDTDLRCNGDS